MRCEAVKVSINSDVCIGAGNCVLSAEKVFDQDDFGIVMLIDESPSTQQHQAVREAALLCPANAIKVTERPEFGE
jgi:ferredoxin